MDDLEIRSGQQGGTLAAVSAESCHTSNCNRVNNNGKTIKGAKEKELMEGG